MKQYDGAYSECADLHIFDYGKALLENAIAQNSVLVKKKEGTEVEEGEENKVSNTGRIHFGEDAVPEEPDTDEMGGEKTINLFAGALKERHDAEEEQKGGYEGEAEGEPEDDSNVAWDVIEMMRSLYEDQKEVGATLK